MQKIRILICSVLPCLLCLLSFSPRVVSATPQINEYPVPTPYAGITSITAGPDGNIWFTEENQSQIGRVTPNGTITEFPTPTPNSYPVQIISGPGGDMWFTEDGASNIAKITPSGVITEYPVTTLYSQPTAIVVGPDGNLWFTEWSGNNIGEMNASGSMVAEYPITSPNSYPEGIAYGSDGNLWFTEGGNNNIAKMTPTGVVTEYPLPTLNAEPLAITPGPDGNLWFSELEAGNIGKITTSGIITEYPTTSPNSAPGDIVTGPNGNLWFTETNTLDPTPSNIGEISTTGSMIAEYPTPTSDAHPSSITVGADGNIWFGENHANQIGELILPAKPGISNQTVTTSINHSVSTNVLNNISGDPDSSTLAITIDPSHGTASVNQGIIKYSPAADYTGDDTLTYKVCSTLDNGICNTATLTFVISAVDPDTGFGTPGSINLFETYSSYVVAISSIVVLASGIRKFTTDRKTSR